MTHDKHPAGYTVAMRQLMLTAALVIGGVAAAATPSMFATSIFADAYFKVADSLPVGYFVAQVGGAVPVSGTAAPAKLQKQKPFSGSAGQGMQNMQKPQSLSPAEIVKILVAGGVIPEDKVQTAIELLRKAMAGQATVNARVCMNFARQLKMGDRGEDVKQLNLLLQKEGFEVPEGDEYSEQTSSAVTGLQEKYASDVLAPSNLKHGTGIVGKGTLMKLNKLQQCADKMPETSASQQNTSGIQGINQPTPEMLKKKAELEQKYREMCAAGKCPDPRTLNGVPGIFPMKPPTNTNTGATMPSGTVAPTPAPSPAADANTTTIQ